MKLKLRNKIEHLMRDAGINTFEEMSQRMTNNQGWKIGRTSLSRKIRDENVSLDLFMVEAICNELNCLPGDLFETTISDVSDEEIASITNKFLPFRYGNIVKTPRVSDVANDQQTSVISSVYKSDKKKEVEIDGESIFGPKVTHLTIDKLKK